MARKVVLFGSAGQLGVELGLEFSARGAMVLGFTRPMLDLLDPDAVDKAIGETQPDVVLNAAAYNQVDLAEREPQAAFQVNALAVRNIAAACRQVDALLVHFSTDYVFDGTLGRPYVETDPVHPLGAYAVSKLAGEFYAQAYLEAPLIIRTSGVFGPAGLRTPHGNFVETMLRLAARQRESGQPIRVVEDHAASPTYAPALAARTADLVESNVRGIVHGGGGTPISWFEYAKLIFAKAGLRPEVHPTNEREYRTAARRPKFSALENARMREAGIAPMPPLEEAVADYFARREALARAGV